MKHPQIYRLASLFSLIALAALCFGLATGCQTHLATGGPYSPTNGAPDILLFQADQSFNVAYATFTAISDYEKANRAQLWKISPTIKHTLDIYRPQAAEVFFRWGPARQAYLNNQLPANFTTLEGLVAEIQNITTAVQAGTTLTNL